MRPTDGEGRLATAALRFGIALVVGAAFIAAMGGVAWFMGIPTVPTVPPPVATEASNGR